MKKLIILLALLMLFSCSSQKKENFTKGTLAQQDCPDDGTCTVTVEKNKSLNITSDEFGSVFYELLDSPDKNVIMYEYSRNVDTTLADAGYREQIIIEVDTAQPEMQMTGGQLASAKVLFARLCFCRGATGYYRVRDGSLAVKKDGKKLLVDMDFKITEVPQIINKINLIIE